MLQTDDRGATWSDVTSTFETTLEGAGNTLGSQTFAATRALMIFYRTAANPFELADNSQNRFLSINRVYANSRSFTDDGVILISNLINKVCESEAFPYSVYVDEVFGYRVPNNSKSFTTSIEVAPTHRAVTALAATTSPAGKVFSTLSFDSNMYLIYKELRHNGTSWGDDNRFNIVDNQSTVTDTNGETVIVGQKRVALPYHFDGDLY